MLILSRRIAQSLFIGNDIKVTVLNAKGRHISIGIEAPSSVPVHRLEVAERIEAEKQADLNQNDSRSE